VAFALLPISSKKTEGSLPRACLRCGAVAEYDIIHKFRTISWGKIVLLWLLLLVVPYALSGKLSVGLIGLVSLLAITPFLCPTAVVACPMCRRHRHHWLWRRIVLWGVIFLFVSAFALAVLHDMGVRSRSAHEKQPCFLGNFRH